MTTFKPKFTIINRMTAAIKQIERARGFSGSGETLRGLGSGYGNSEAGL